MSKSIRILSFVCAGIFLILLLLHSWFGPDIWYHLTWGRDIVTRGLMSPDQRTLLTQPVAANVYLIFQSIMYGAFSAGGIYAVSGIFIALWTAIAVLWMIQTGLWRRPLVGAWLLLAFIVCNQSRFEHRPEVFSYLFVLLFLMWFQRAREQAPGRKEFAMLFALQVIWTNTHGYFVLGVLIAGAFALAERFERGALGQRVMNAFAAFGICLAGSFVSPSIWGGWQSVLENSRVAAGLRDLNAELFSPVFWPPFPPLSLFWCFWALAIALSLRALYRRENLFAAFLSLGGAALAASAVRNIPLVFLLSAPLLRTLPVWPARRSPGTGGVAAAISSLAAAAVAVWLSATVVQGKFHRYVGSLGGFGVHLEWAAYPIGAVEFLQANGFHGKIFTDSYDGGYVEYHLPGARIAGDSYFSDPDITHEFFAAIREPAQLEGLDQRFTFDALLINIENLEVMDAVLTGPAWALAYSDSHRALFFRKALWPKDPIQLSSSNYYHGEDLRDWMYAFGPISWAAVARKHRDRALLAKIVDDVSRADAIPSTFVKMALGFGVDNYDKPLIAALQPLLSKTFEAEDGDASALAALQEKARRCCQ
jgi:hypothetical protein